MLEGNGVMTEGLTTPRQSDSTYSRVLRVGVPGTVPGSKTIFYDPVCRTTKCSTSFGANSHFKSIISREDTFVAASVLRTMESVRANRDNKYRFPHAQTSPVRTLPPAVGNTYVRYCRRVFRRSLPDSWKRTPPPLQENVFRRRTC